MPDAAFMNFLLAANPPPHSDPRCPTTFLFASFDHHHHHRHHHHRSPGLYSSLIYLPVTTATMTSSAVWNFVPKKNLGLAPLYPVNRPGETALRRGWGTETTFLACSSETRADCPGTVDVLDALQREVYQPIERVSSRSVIPFNGALKILLVSRSLLR